MFFVCIAVLTNSIKYTYKFARLRAIVGAHPNIKQATFFFHPRLFLIEKQGFTGVVYNLLIIEINYSFGKS